MIKIDGDKIIDEIMTEQKAKAERLQQGINNHCSKWTQQAAYILMLQEKGLLNDYLAGKNFGMFKGFGHAEEGTGIPRQLIDFANENGFLWLHEYSQGNIRAIWTNEKAKTVLTFVEGDIYLKVMESDKQYQEELQEMKNYYKEVN